MTTAKKRKLWRDLGTLLITALSVTGCGNYKAPLDPLMFYPIVTRTELSQATVLARIKHASDACYSKSNMTVTLDASRAPTSVTLHFTMGSTTLGIELAQIEVAREVTGSAVLLRLKNEQQSEFASAVPQWLAQNYSQCPYR